MIEKRFAKEMRVILDDWFDSLVRDDCYEIGSIGDADLDTLSSTIFKSLKKGELEID